MVRAEKCSEQIEKEKNNSVGLNTQTSFCVSAGLW